MKTTLASFGWLLLLIPVISFAGAKTLSNNSGVSSETRSVSDFFGISSSGSWHVHITMGTTESLRIEGDEDLIEKIETKVEKGTLHIRSVKTGSWGWTSAKVDIYITARQLKNLSQSGSGKIEVEGTLRENTLNAQLSGSGSMSFQAESSTLNAAISGSGKIKARGTAANTNISISGSGSFEGRDLRAAKVQAQVSGSGSAEVYAEDDLNAALSGSGNIRYSGNANVSQRKSGSGRISRL